MIVGVLAAIPLSFRAVEDPAEPVAAAVRERCAPAARAAAGAAARPTPIRVRARGPATLPGTAGFAGGGAMHRLGRKTLRRELDAMTKAGGRWLRFDINWNVVQCGGPRSWNWAPFDRVVAGARARGIEVLALITYTPPWARPPGTTGRYAPDPALYAAFARAVARRYAPRGVHAYEIWNEPNVPSFWQPAPDPAAYARLLQAAYPAIKAADPRATVVTGGTAPAATDGRSYAPIDFVRAMYAAGAHGSFDALGHHPYTFPAFPRVERPWSAWYQMFGSTPSLRSTMIDNGDGDKKIWATEYGAPTDGPAGSHAVSEGTQATMVTDAYARFRTYDWAGPLMWYSQRDRGTAITTRENHFGILRKDFSAKPGFSRFRRAAAR